MGVRSRIATALATVAKTFGTAVPGAIQAAEVAAGMGPTKPFSPGEPIGPYDGYSRTPRSHDFTTGYNIASRPRTHERVAFDTLKGLVEAYDVAQMCIWHRIDSIRSLDWSLVAADGHDGDVSDEIKTGLQVLAKPDGQQPFASWIASWLYDVLAYDAGTLYRLRNRGGRCIGLRVVDGTTIAPLLDYWGNPPEAPAEAFVQYANGLPWNWLTRDDLIYTPFRKRPNSVYGTAPLESILLNANTDLRFQAYFLQRFTEGNIPEAFASAPETWTPDQIEEFQKYWDALLLGDQAGKHQIRWMPGGSSIAWSNEKDFTDGFSLFLMRKTAAAYHVVPADLGFTENVNRSSGESQADVQHRVGDLPLIRHIQHVLTGFLQEDLGLPLRFAFDLGEEQVDQLAQAQADQIYIQMGAISPSDVREMRYGLPEPDGQPVPRFVFSPRSGPIPLSSLYGVAGQIDPETAAPKPGAPLPHDAFAGVPGTEPTPPLVTEPLAEELYGAGAIPPMPPGQQPAPGQPVTKDGTAAAGPTAGITADTGITGYDLIGHDDEENDGPGDDELVKAELAAFRKFRKARRRAGQWRDFEFAYADPATARRLNDEGRGAVMKDRDGAVPGLTKRSGMISLDLPPGTVPAVPGGPSDHHITVVYLGSDLSDGVYAAACSRAQAAAAKIAGPLIGTASGVDSFEPSVGSEGKVPAFAPVTLPGVEVLRAELEDLSASEHKDYHPHITLSYLDEGESLPDPVAPTLLTFTHLTVHRGNEAVSFPLGGVSASDSPVGKSATGPKGDAPAKGAHWPGWDLDEQCADHWAPLAANALTGALSAAAAGRLARDYADNGPDTGKREPTDAAYEWLARQGLDLATPLIEVLTGMYTDAYLIGLACARASLDGGKLQLGGWAPGDAAAARDAIEALGGTDGLTETITAIPDEAGSIADGYLHDLARELTADAPTVAKGRAGDALRGRLGNSSRARTAAITTISRGSSRAALWWYRLRGIRNGRWLLDPNSSGCPVCDMNANAGPVPLGKAYPSGDVQPPSHPNCRCALVGA